MTILAETSTGWTTPSNYGGADNPIYNSTVVTATAGGTANNIIMNLPATAWTLSATTFKVVIYRQSTLNSVGTATFVVADGTGAVTKALGASFSVANGEQFYGLYVADGTTILQGDTTGFLMNLRTGTFASPPGSIVPGSDTADTRPQFRFSIDGTVIVPQPAVGWERQGAMGVMVAM